MTFDVTTPKGVRAAQRAGYWGSDGWQWERLKPEDMTKSDPTLACYMVTPARQGEESKQGGPACKVEIWRNAHWFVSLSRDECVLCTSEHNAGGANEELDAWPEMIWLSMRRTDRSRATDRDWREMQRVKNDLVGDEHDAVELYPAERRIVDTADQFHHLWVLADSRMTFPFGYLERAVGNDPDEGGTQRPR